jgi:hypothetical protein
VTRQTFRYWAQQMGIGYGVIALSSFMLMMLLMALALDHWVWFPFWMGLGAVFMAERIVTVWPAGWRGRLLALPLLPELMYDLFLDAVYVKGVLDISLGRTSGSTSPRASRQRWWADEPSHRPQRAAHVDHVVRGVPHPRGVRGPQHRHVRRGHGGEAAAAGEPCRAPAWPLRAVRDPEHLPGRSALTADSLFPSGRSRWTIIW